MKRNKTWSLEEQGQFLLQLGKLLDKGYSLSQAIEFLEIQHPLSRRHNLQRCLSFLRSGLSFHEALQPLLFHSEAVGYLFFAEQHGRLAQGLIEAGSMLLNKAKYWQRLRKAASYPLFLLCFMMVMLLFVQWMLLPQFIHLSSSFHTNRFSTSRVLIQVVSLFPSLFLIVCLIGGVVAIGYVFWLKKLPPIAQMSVWMKIPFVRTVIMLYHTHLFALQFSHLLNGGLSVYESLQVFEKQQNIPFLRAEGSAMKEQLANGEKLETIIAMRPYYEPALVLVIRHGQSNGELAKELFHYSQFVLQKIEEKMERWTRIVQPLLFSVIGLLVVCMYLAILLPMFETMNQL
ncbi:competence protein ComGB [Anoxybacillus tepidamans]|uniref:Competence protein ComGB n=1 Tax=Anoxybacteroides tepidamans TaxID=265948 RepID=A0A7W8IR64_9BACL|nr:competence type IV pilus assembly protein ComGB [Anoxybacillus tepidamans]MBB5325221.1 competence protein ComGB [Anoxybacillus tepidamans]